MQEFIATLKDNYQDIFKDRIFVSEAESKKYLNDIELCLQSDFQDRETVEGNKFFLQLVAYTIILNPDKKKIFVAKRINGDSRLNNKYCIGFGGHVDMKDFYFPDKNSIPNPIYQTAIRELREELNIKNKSLELEHIGYVRDLSSDTSEHLGSVYFLITGSSSIKEKHSFMDGKWVSYEDFKNNYYSKLEGWSKNIFDYIYENPEMIKKFNF